MPVARPRSYAPSMSYEYKVVELRSKMFGGAINGDKLEKTLDEWASRGWQFKTMTSIDVEGRVGPGGVDGLVITFERQV